MFKLFSPNYALFSMAADGLLTVSALALTNALRVPCLRTVWPEISFYEQGKFIPAHLWPVVSLVWCVVFVFTSVYHPKRNYEAVDQFQNVVAGATFAGLALAEVLYLTRRDLSRWLFVLFLMLDWVLLLGCW